MDRGAQATYLTAHVLPCCPQTHKTVRELCKYTDLRTACLVGGDSMEAQFEELAGNPDIIVATPGGCTWVNTQASLWPRRVVARGLRTGVLVASEWGKRRVADGLGGGPCTGLSVLGVVAGVCRL